MIVAIIGMAATPAVGSSLGTGQRAGHSAVKVSQVKRHKRAKKHRGAKKCEKGRVRKNGKCVKRRKLSPASSRTGAGTTGPGKGELDIKYSSGSGFAELNYTLNCDPASGTLADPAAACAEIARHPGMVFEGAHGDHSCPKGEPYIDVTGEYEGQQVNVWFSPCGFGGASERNWLPYMPTDKQENEVSVDHGIGPVALGEPQSSAEALLASTLAGSVGGLYIYHPWDFVSGSCVRGLGIGGKESKQDLAIRYDSDGRLETVMGNTNGLTIEGHEVWSLLVRCPHPPEVEAVSHSEGPLTGWVSVTCAGHEAMADHPVSEDQTTQDTTLIIPAGEGDSWPLVIVTSNPTSACQDAARLNAEWGALLN